MIFPGLGPPMVSFGTQSGGGLLTADTDDLIATDFRNHLNADDWEISDAGSPLSASLVSGGLISDNAIRISYGGGISTLRWMEWAFSREISTVDQEILALIKMANPTTSGTSPNIWIIEQGVGLLLHRDSNRDLVAGGYGWDASGSDRIRAIWSLDEENGKDSRIDFSWSTNTAYWMRLRIEPTRTAHLKIWAFGNSEPGSFQQSLSAASSEWPSGAGRAGIILGSFSGAAKQLDCHYIAVAYNGTTAPVP